MKVIECDSRDMLSQLDVIPLMNNTADFLKIIIMWSCTFLTTTNCHIFTKLWRIDKLKVSNDVGLTWRQICEFLMKLYFLNLIIK